MSLNLDPRQWGARLWRSLHTIAFAYPEQPSDVQQGAAIGLLKALEQLLPCEKCRKHYSAYLAEHPPRVESREAFARYLNELHNAVNQRLGKETIIYDPARAYGKAKSTWGQIVLAILLGVAIGILICKYWK